MRIKTLLIFVLAGFCLAGPANAGSRFVVLSARHSFSVPHIAHNAMLHNGAILRNHRRFFGGAEVTYGSFAGCRLPDRAGLFDRGSSVAAVSTGSLLSGLLRAATTLRPTQDYLSHG
jgi:hypothetical protein